MSAFTPDLLLPRVHKVLNPWFKLNRLRVNALTQLLSGLVNPDYNPHPEVD